MTDDNDPFAPFRRMFEQFEASSSPDGVPGFELPVTPFPMPGGDGGPLSPEESTKRAVRQLYGVLAGLSSDSAPPAMMDVWEQYAELFDIDTSLSGAPEQAAAATATTYRLWLYGFAQILVESYTLRLIHDELVVEDHRHSTGTQQWLWTLPQSEREQLLLRCTDVDDDLVEEMQTARQQRDELLYDFGSWDETEFEDSLTDAQRYLRVLTDLDALVNEENPFSFFPDAAAEDAE